MTHHDGLGVARPPDVRGQDPVAGELGKHPLKVVDAKRDRLGVRHAVELGALRQILGEIDEVPAGVGFRRLEIGMLDDADEGKTGIVDVEPIGMGEAGVQLEHHA